MSERSERVEERLDDQTERLERIEDSLEELVELAGARDRPATIDTVALSATQPVHRMASGAGETLSVGILNPSAATIFIGVGGGSATAAARAPAVPPGGLLVLPLPLDEFEIGAEGQDAVVYVLRFATVQPAHLGH